MKTSIHRQLEDYLVQCVGEISRIISLKIISLYEQYHLSPLLFSLISAHVFFVLQRLPFTAGLTALSREHATTAYRAWLKVAEKGDAEGQNNVGFFYERGLGVSQDYKQAEAWYMMASAQGDFPPRNIT